MSSNRVLITGGTGYIGSHAALAFRDHGYDVSVVDDLSNSKRQALPSSFPCYIGDLRNQDFLSSTFAAVRPDGVLHFAGAVVVPESIDYPLKYYSRNSYATLLLLEEMQRRSVAKIVFSSTAAVYGLPKDGIAREDSLLSPINPYGYSKLMSEQIINDTALASSSSATPLRTAILRYFNVAGADAKMRTGQQGRNATHLVKSICRTLTGQQAHLKIFGTDLDTPDGSCIRDYIHVSDLVDLHLQAYRSLEREDKHLLFNCGYGNGTSVRTMVACAEKTSGRTVPLEIAPPRQGDPPILIADNKRLKALFPDWQPIENSGENSIEQILRSALDWEEHCLGK